jgi:hypothetical protein
MGSNPIPTVRARRTHASRDFVTVGFESGRAQSSERSEEGSDRLWFKSHPHRVSRESHAEHREACARHNLSEKARPLGFEAGSGVSASEPNDWDSNPIPTVFCHKQTREWQMRTVGSESDRDSVWNANARVGFELYPPRHYGESNAPPDSDASMRPRISGATVSVRRSPDRVGPREAPYFDVCFSRRDTRTSRYPGRERRPVRKARAAWIFVPTTFRAPARTVHRTPETQGRTDGLPPSEGSDGRVPRAWW